MPQIGHIHKFIHKYSTNINRPEDRPIMWRFHQDAEHMSIQYSSYKFGFLAQQDLTIQPRTAPGLTKSSILMIQIPIGCTLRRGLVFVTLKNDHRLKGLLIPDGVISESVENIVVSLQNNSDSVVTIQKGEQIGYITHSSAN